MKKRFPESRHASILTYLVISVISFVFWVFISAPTPVYAASSCQFTSATRSPNGNLNLGVTGLEPGRTYKVKVNPNATGLGNETTQEITADSSGNMTVTVSSVTADSNIQVVVVENIAMAACVLAKGSYVSVGDAITKITGKTYTRPTLTVCSYAGDKEGECNSCLSGSGENGGIWTALGCIHYNQDQFTLDIVKIIMGVAGFISLAMMLVGAIMFMTGGSNPEQVKRGKELFTGAVVGLLFLIFSVVILQIITKDVIKIDL